MDHQLYCQSQLDLIHVHGRASLAECFELLHDSILDSVLVLSRHAREETLRTLIVSLSYLQFNCALGCWHRVCAIFEHEEEKGHTLLFIKLLSHEYALKIVHCEPL